MRIYILRSSTFSFIFLLDSLLKVIVNGNIDEARTFSETLGQGELREETQQEEEVESEHSGSKVGVVGCIIVKCPISCFIEKEKTQILKAFGRR